MSDDSRLPSSNQYADLPRMLREAKLESGEALRTLRRLAAEEIERLVHDVEQASKAAGIEATENQRLRESIRWVVDECSLDEIRSALRALLSGDSSAPETSDERSKAAMVTRGELGALTIRLAEAEVILAQALACNDYEPQHVEWLTDAANWLNRPNYHLFVLPAHQLGPKTAPVSGAEASGGRQASSEETTACPHGFVPETCDICERTQKASTPHIHVWQKAPDSELALCACGDYSDDWYCAESPDHVCHYRKGDFDQCDYCGQPEERK